MFRKVGCRSVPEHGCHRTYPWNHQTMPVEWNEIYSIKIAICWILCRKHKQRSLLDSSQFSQHGKLILARGFTKPIELGCRIAE